MKFHVTLGYKKKVIDVVYPYVIRSVITRAFNLPISNFNIQKWNDEWHDWVDVEPPELTDGDRLNLVINPPELVMGLSSPGASGGVIGLSPAASPMVSTPIVTSNNFISNSSMIANSSLMVNSPMVTNSSLMSGFEESVPASSNCLQDMVDTLMPDTDRHEAASSTVLNHTKSDVRSKLVHSEHREFKPWPVPFRIPTHLFRPELKATLASKQILSRKMKSALIQAIYDEMINYTVYPTSSQYKEVAMAIITEYSHLRDNIPGSKGYESWSATLSDKFRNERRIMTNIEVVEKRKRRRVVTEPESLGDPSEKSMTIPSSYRQTQEGLESWTTSSGISSLIESLEGCSAATTTTSTSRAIISEELPSFSSTSVKSPSPFKKAYVESEHSDGILKSLSWLWRTNKLCDAVICSGETKIMLHRLILFAVSPHLLEKNIRDGAELEVNLPSGINDEALATFVAFLYDGVLNLTEYNYKDIERVGNLLKVEKVQRYCREFANSLAEYKLHQPLPMPLAPVMMEGGNHEYVGKRKRGRPSKQTVVLNLGDDHSLGGDRLDPSHYLQSGELSSYHSMALSGATMSRMNSSDMPVVFPDSQEYCLPSTSQTSQLFSTNQGHVKTEPYQQSPEFCSPFHINPKGSKSNSSKDDAAADHISSFVSHETSGKSSTTMDIQTTTATTTNNDDDDDDEDNNTTANNNNNNSNNDDNGKNSAASCATTERNSSSKSSAKSYSSPPPPSSSKGDGVPSETQQSSPPYAASVVASSGGDGFSLYSLASS